MKKELFEIYERNFSFLLRGKEAVQQVLGNADNIIIEQRDAQHNLIGVSVLHQNTILLLCVDAGHRGKGIGSRLLERSEQTVLKGGYAEIRAGAGADYIMPGVPTARRYFEAENESLSPMVDETADNFFTKRGYRHSWDCNCFDMRLPLKQFENEECRVGDTIAKITYRWAAPEERDKVCACTDDAYPEFTRYYQEEGLYQPQNGTRVLAAVSDGEIVGTLLVGTEDAEGGVGGLGCTAVKHAFRGKHIAVNLVTIGTKHLKDIGMKEAYLGYTYSGLDHLYGYAGYKICVYYMMAVKRL